MSFRYQKSESLLEKALHVIPLGTQTFSKSKTQYPQGAAPFYVTHAQGSHVWDVDGNEYIDFVNGLAAITLGHCDAEVSAAVEKQLHKGVLFSLPHPLEIEVAEKIVELVPSAQMVRFGKNGSDVTSAAIRLARAFTGRNHIVTCGYHGWQDWYIGTTSKNLGIPSEVCSLSHKFSYNSIESLEKLFREFPKQIAAVIMEPMNSSFPSDNFLQQVRDLCDAQGALLIFDEVITGFRLAPGGAQELFGVTPDLTTLGKGLANGYPLSAIAGRADIMRLLEEVFFSFTFGGETLSLAAANVVLQKVKTQGVTEQLATTGKVLVETVSALIQKHNVSEILGLSGHPAWTFLTFKDTAFYPGYAVKTLFLQEVLKRGILTIGTHNISAAHSLKDIEVLGCVYDEVFGLLKEAVQNKKLERLLECKVVEPLFKVR